MDVIIDGASLATAASRIDTALRDLSLVMQRVRPLLVELASKGALTSAGLDQKYQGELGEAVDKVGEELGALQHVSSQLLAAYVGEVDQIDSFVY